ncbi:DUF4405 domain-containing protein [bacterium SCSIO 12741]|nr:DUF4405 domain-containing protein [bacterium SCSIO 12741]
MMKRSIVSLLILLSFTVLAITGILEYFRPHTHFIQSLHTWFGFVFLLAAVFHLTNNLRPIKSYLKKKSVYGIGMILALVVAAIYWTLPPFETVMEWGTQIRAQGKQEVDPEQRDILRMNTSHETQLHLDLLRGEHYWHPQMVIWTEDTNGQFLETLFVSKATAKGLFFGGRNKDNFKTFDEELDSEGDYRRVDALPVWSHKRGVQYADGMYVPPSNQPLPDGITGATLQGNFNLHTSSQNTSPFVVRLEINVAFDDNEYYSEYDFPDDEVYHSGTGQLGQPSLVFEAQVNPEIKSYQMMQLIGHGHQSGQSGEINPDLSTLTTALEIVERIVIGVQPKK